MCPVHLINAPLPALLWHPQERLGQLRALVPLGGGVHAQAEVPDTSRIYVHIALGFHPGGQVTGWAVVAASLLPQAGRRVRTPPHTRLLDGCSKLAC